MTRWSPHGTFSVSGVFPTKLPSSSISAAVGKELIVTETNASFSTDLSLPFKLGEVVAGAAGTGSEPFVWNAMSSN